MKTKFKNILIALIAIPLFSISLNSCEDDDDEIETITIETIVRDTVTITDSTKFYQVDINLKNMVNGVDLVMNSTNKPYTNSLNQPFNVTRLRYLISDISFHKADGSCYTIKEYHFVDATDNATLMFSPISKVPEGDYSSISFKFGFDSEDNQDGTYADLNSANWNWPMMLGGGYHFMQFEGKFDTSNVEGLFATHMGTARNNTVSPTTFEDNHFVAKPAASAISIANDRSFDIIMNLEQWYEAPYDWDFKVYSLPIMPIYDAQRKLNLNGPSVFTVNI
jgi:hypothetical protein